MIGSLHPDVVLLCKLLILASAGVLLLAVFIVANGLDRRAVTPPEHPYASPRDLAPPQDLR